MVSIPTTSPLYLLSPPRPTIPFLHHRGNPPYHRRNPPYHRLRPVPHRFAISNLSPNTSSSESDPPHRNENTTRDPVPTLFPGGYKRPEISVPAVVLKVSAAEVLGDVNCRNAIDLALAEGVVGVVVLTCDGDDGGGRLYEAAGVVRTVVGDRAYFVVDERVDVAAAVGASGVVLSDRGLPAIVARNMMLKSTVQSILLPLVARYVQTAGDAVSASGSEGADFLIINTDMKKYAQILSDITTLDVKIPVFFSLVGLVGEGSLCNTTTKLLQSGANGIVLSFDNLHSFTDDTLKRLFLNTYKVKRKMQTGGLYSKKSLIVSDETKKLYQRPMVAGFTKLSDREIEFIETERNILLEAVNVIRTTAPLVIS